MPSTPSGAAHSRSPRSDRAGPVRVAAPHAGAAAPAHAAGPGWRSCPHCWGQRRVIEYRPAANGEGRIPRVEACRTCLGIGEVLL
jgi:hypothetical protein